MGDGSPRQSADWLAMTRCGGRGRIAAPVCGLARNDTLRRDKDGGGARKMSLHGSAETFFRYVLPIPRRMEGALGMRSRSERNSNSLTCNLGNTDILDKRSIIVLFQCTVYVHPHHNCDST